jgi:hypothetical protein
MVLAGCLSVGTRTLVVIVFLVALIGKVRSRHAIASFITWVAELSIAGTRQARLLAYAILAIEMAVVVMVLAPWTAIFGLAVAAGTMCAFAIATGRLVRRGTRARCQCFGTSGATLSHRHVFRDASIALAATAGIAVSQTGAPPLPGIALGIAAGALVAAVVLFLDDIAALFAA